MSKGSKYTLYLVCTLKGMCQYTVVRIKAMHVRVKMMSKGSKEALTVLIITHVTQVERVESGVCGSYTTPYADVWKLHKVASRPCLEERLLWAFRLGGLAVHHRSVQGGSFVKFLGLVNYKGDCRQDAQPIPNSYIN